MIFIHLIACACNEEGAADDTCDVTSGVCTCIDKVSGDKCDTCKTGYYNFPTCQGT